MARWTPSAMRSAYTSPQTPITRYAWRSLRDAMRTIRPIALASPNSACATDALMTMPGVSVRRSPGWKVRPARSGMPITAKKLADVMFSLTVTSAGGAPSRSASSRGWTCNSCGVSGNCIAVAASVTPGSARSTRTSSRWNAAARWFVE